MVARSRLLVAAIRVDAAAGVVSVLLALAQLLHTREPRCFLWLFERDGLSSRRYRIMRVLWSAVFRYVAVDIGTYG